MAHGQKAIGIKIGIVVVLLLSLTSPATAQVCDQPPPAGLIGWWTGDIDETDSAGNPPNHADLQNGATAGVPGLINGAFAFDGQNEVANTALILPSVGTLDFWANPAALSGAIQSLIGAFGITGDNPSRHFRFAQQRVTTREFGE